MTIKEIFLKECFVVEPTVYEDDRGYFMESYNKERFLKETGIDVDFIQDNEARSSYGVIRGLHFQKAPYEQAKLVRVIEGKVLDVALDLRKESATYGEYFIIELSAENKKQLFVPRGFAHGYSVLSQTALFAYKCDNAYHQQSESGIAFDDKSLDIKWQLDKEHQIISLKDKEQQSLTDYSKELERTIKQGLNK